MKTPTTKKKYDLTGIKSKISRWWVFVSVKLSRIISHGNFNEWSYRKQVFSEAPSCRVEQRVGAAGSSQQPPSSEWELFFSQKQWGFSDCTRRIFLTLGAHLLLKAANKEDHLPGLAPSPSRLSVLGRCRFFPFLFLYVFTPDSLSVAHSGFFCWHGRLSRCQ